MVKISRPVIYAAVLGAVAYGAFVLTEPAPVPKKKKTKIVASATASKSGILPEDRNANFGPYTPKQGRNAFLPRVITARAIALNSPPPVGPGIKPAAQSAGWVLTGITAINNTKSALIENNATGDSVFVKAGDKWNGFRIVRIGESAVQLADASGRQTSLLFPEPPEETTPNGPVAPNALPSPSGLPAGVPSPAPAPRQLADQRQGGVNGI